MEWTAKTEGVNSNTSPDERERPNLTFWHRGNGFVYPKMKNGLKRKFGGVGVNKQEIERALRNYHWMIKEITRLRSILEDAGESIVKPMNEESDMPKPKGNTSDPVFLEVSRREKQWKRIERLERKVRFVQEHIDCITDDRERTVLDCMLDGMTLVAIALHLGTSEKQVRRIKDSIVDRIAENAENAENADFAEKADLLQVEKAMI